jgi:2-C-methyl-D-erythritol 2,4-cyclodiphosphate synthase
VSDKLKATGYALVNADITIIAQKPKLAPYIETMAENVARILKTDIGNINVKATTERGSASRGRARALPPTL